jgi:protein gp37
MAENTAIEWADDTLNWWWGCTEVSPACDNCYARTLAARRRWRPHAPAHASERARTLATTICWRARPPPPTELARVHSIRPHTHRR